jgi:hypothetical protein
MNITIALQNLPLERLREIVRRRLSSAREVPRIADRPALIGFLANVLSDRNSIHRALSDTDLLQLRVLIHAIVESGSVSLEALTQIAGPGSQERLKAAVDGLEALGLAFWHGRGSGNIFVPNAVRQHTPLPAPLRNLLAPSLDRYNLAILSHIAKTLGIEPSRQIGKNAFVQAIIRELTADRSLQARVEALSPEVRRLLTYVVRAGGAAGLAELGQQVDSRHRNQLYTYDWSSRWSQGTPRNAVEELLCRGLLVMEGQVGWGYGRLVIPGDVLTLLTGRSLLGGLPNVPTWETIPGGQGSVRGHDTLVRDVTYLLAYLGRNDAARTAKGIIHRSVLKSVAKGLTEPSAEYAGFVYALTREAGLAAPQGKHGFYDITGAGFTWLEMPHDEQLRSLYDVWRTQAVWAEIAQEPLVDDRSFYHFDDVRAYRACAVTLLADLGRERPGEMASLASLAEIARYRWWSRFPSDAPGEGGQGMLGEADVEGNENEEDESGLAGSGLLVRLFRSLILLGLAQQIVDVQGRPTHYGLSEVGRRVILGEEAKNPRAAVESFIVQPNLEVYAPPNLSPRLLYRLYRISEPASNGLLSVSRESLRQAFDTGENVKDLLKFLAQHSQKSVPQNVEYLIKEVGGRHGHIRVGQAGIYLQVDDPVLLKELKAQKKLDVHFRGQLADTVALVTGDSVESILKQLRQAGYFPVSDNERTAARPPSGKSARTYTPPREPKASHQDIDARIQWASIAEETGAHWEDAAEVDPEPRIANSPEEVADLVEEAVERGLCLEIVYQAQDKGPITERVIEPVALYGSLVEAFCRARQDMRHFNVRYIRRARLTGETFDAEERLF